MGNNVIIKREQQQAKAWGELAEMLEAGTIRGYLEVGDQIIAKHDALGNVVFDILDFDKEELAEEKTRSITLQMHDLIIPETPFDKDGCNKWEISSLREEINGEEFINGFEPGFRDLLTQVYKKNDDRQKTIDTFFLLSIEEMTVIDEHYEYYSNRANMRKTDKYGYGDRYFTRSAYRGNAYNTWYVNSSGLVSNNDAINANRCAPACVIAK